MLMRKVGNVIGIVLMIPAALGMLVASRDAAWFLRGGAWATFPVDTVICLIFLGAAWFLLRDQLDKETPRRVFSWVAVGCILAGQLIGWNTQFPAIPRLLMQ